MSAVRRASLARLVRSPAAPVVVGVALMGVGIALRWPVVDFRGALSGQSRFNAYLFGQSWAAYSDIASLFVRDGQFRHPLPYFDYRLEYPVLTGGFMYLMSLVGGSLAGYFLASAAVLAGLGGAAIALIRRFPGSNVWLLAASPAIALYAATNWDLLAMLPAFGALLLYVRGRDGWAGAVLALAASAKLFPALLLPFAVLVALMERRFRAAAASVAAFALVTLALNLPVALRPSGGGLAVRDGWSWFFRFNERRPPEISVYQYIHPSGLGTHGVNLVSAVALAVILAALLIATARRFGAERSRAVLVPAFAAALMAFLFVNKVYSPQYTLWVMAVLALLGAPLALAAGFAVVDLFATYVGFHQFAITTEPTRRDYIAGVLDPAGAVRELMVLAVLAWCCARLARTARARTGVTAGPPAGPRNALRAP